MVRDSEGQIGALLNSRRHRGTRLCRADSDSARSFVCHYHGWSYERDGRPITTTCDWHLPIHEWDGMTETDASDESSKDPGAEDEGSTYTRSIVS